MGRVKRFSNMVGTMLSDEQLDEITRITDEMEISKSEFVRKVLVDWLEKHEGGNENEG